MKTVATSGDGLRELVDAMSAFRAHTERDGAASRATARLSRRRLRAEQRLREVVSQRFADYLERHVLAAGERASLVERIAAREIDPYSAADDLLTRAGLKT